MVDVNQAVFDPGNDFHGVIAGVHEMLRQQGLLDGTWCLDPAEGCRPARRRRSSGCATRTPT